ncbi:MAG: cell division protein FtsA [Campylobacterales bacterium]
MSDVVLGIDIGSSKICAVIAEIKDKKPHIIGTGIVTHGVRKGIRKGIITNIDYAATAIKSAVNDARRVAGTSVSEAIVSVSGAYCKGTNSRGIVNIPQNEIGIREINRVMQTAVYNSTPLNEYEVIHVLPNSFTVDEQENIDDPIGMNGSRLEVEVHIITAQKSTLNNLKKAVKAAGIEIKNLVLSGYASSIATINEDEKELGVAMVDLGDTSSNLAVHVGNSIKYNDFLAVGSNHITNDLSISLHTPIVAAEKTKIEYGTLKDGEESKGKLIELPLMGDNQIKQQFSLSLIQNIISARVEETLILVNKLIERSGQKELLGGGIVLTGGYTKLEGIREVASEIFDHLPVRVAHPRELEGVFEALKDPSFSCSIGLILYGSGYFTNYELDYYKNLRSNNEMNEKHELKEERSEPPRLDELLPKKEHGGDLSNIPKIKNTEGQDGVFSKFYRWITQLF